jgi:2-oxo-4-hydroxy-4-carboxy-5-ureidoimidazoline decarboxylase
LTLENFNRISEYDARAALHECCASTEWVRAMAARRPFTSEAGLFSAADEIWWKLGEADWREALAGHPQIGAGHAQQRWSNQEQSGMLSAGGDTKLSMEKGNRAYFEKFGYIYIVCATGKTGTEMLADLIERLKNEPATEIRIAATEQSKITQIRLRKMLTP